MCPLFQKGSFGIFGSRFPTCDPGVIHVVCNHNFPHLNPIAFPRDNNDFIKSHEYKWIVPKRIRQACIVDPLVACHALSHFCTYSKDAGVKWRAGSRPETHSRPTQPAARHCNSSVWSPAKDPGRRGQGRAAAALTHHDDPQPVRRRTRTPADSDSGSEARARARACVRARVCVCVC